MHDMALNGSCQRIKGIAFDLDHTLFDRYSTLRGIAYLLKQRYPDRLNTDFSAAQLGELLVELDRAHIYDGWRVIYEKVAASGAFVNMPPFEEYFSFFLESFQKIAVPFPLVREMLKELREKGYRIGLITNGEAAIQHRKLCMLGLEDAFDQILAGEEMGAQKPSPQPFLEMAKRLGCTPEQMLYVGDNPVNDVEASRRAGCIPVWVKTTEREWMFPEYERPQYEIRDVLELPELLWRMAAGALPAYEREAASGTAVYQVEAFFRGHPLQGFDLYKDVIFQCYDGGYCITYDCHTGGKIAEFALGSCYATNHCGNANFGLEYPEGNTTYPALYISGDLTTKACYVENVTETGAALIQTIFFEIDPSYTGGQVILDRDRERLVYMQRQYPNIKAPENRFKISEFPIPKLSEGAVVTYTNADILDSYELPFYSPLYQGAAIYDGKLLQTHGYMTNALGSRVGIMEFDVETHRFERYLTWTPEIPFEPQGVTRYQDRLIVNFGNGELYELIPDKE